MKTKFKMVVLLWGERRMCLGGGGVGASLLVIDLLNGGPTGVRFFFLHVYV